MPIRIGDFPEVVDSSMLAAFKSCPQLFNKIYIQQWKAKEGRSVHLVAGGAFAKGVEVARKAFYTGHYEAPVVERDPQTGAVKRSWKEIEGPPLSAEMATAVGIQALVHAYGDFVCPADSAKSLERMMGALEFYFSRWPLSHDMNFPVVLPSGKRAIEMSFSEPIDILHPVTGQPIIYVGRADCIMDFAGAAYIEDDKTTTSLGATWGRQWELRSQFIGYTHFFRKTLHVPIRGCLVRGVSILKTKYDSAEVPVAFSEFQCDRWYNELCEWVRDMIICWESGRWRYNLDHSCADYGGCGFLSICGVQNEAPLLETYFERRHWDPVTRVETKL